MKSFRLESPAKLEQLPLTAAEQKSLWMRVAMSAICVVLTVVISFSPFILSYFTYYSCLFLIVGLVMSIVLPHWRHMREAGLKGRLGLSVFYFGLTLFAIIVQMVVFNGPSFVLIPSLFISLELSLILPQLRFRGWKIFSFLILIAWFVLVSISIQPMAKQHYMAVAADIIPKNAPLQLMHIGYGPGSWPDIESNVAYSYSSENPRQDYNKLRDYYKEELSKKGWTMFNDSDELAAQFYKQGLADTPTRNDYASVMFRKPDQASIRITISFHQETPNEVRVDVSF